jgi:hypothetical protein
MLFSGPAMRLRFLPPQNHPQAKRKMIILGIDGMDPKLLQQF